ncbi:FAD-binding oxidoreductase [Ferrimonas futtsuensis]|uniref:FAD-binding oxidoreductase n=1 Tax=Ferrimonas futtsuensis TaxID=364764 RepID=UPI0004210FCD|nr:FAD-binding oxidoreductase [Ferrimonas futtsuensis]
MEKVWNGWGDLNKQRPLPPVAKTVLTSLLGPGHPLGEATLEETAQALPDSRLPAHDLYSIDPQTRARYSRGQSLADWLAFKQGKLGCAPDAVAFPESRDDLQQLLAMATKNNWVVIPYGGGTSVAGHINPRQGQRPVITLSMERMTRLLHLDPVSQLARFEAGVRGPDLEAQLNARGYTLGHFPQSFECSTLGGWIASRSSGQQSLRYGRIEQLFAGGLIHTPKGNINLPTIPASSAGPDWREVFLGSEGRIGIISEADMRVQPLPKKEQFYVSFFPNWDKGLDAVRDIAQAGIPASMMRLSHPTETDTQLQLALSPEKHRRLMKLFRLLKVGDKPAMLTWGVTGDRAQVRHSTRAIRRTLHDHDGRLALKGLGRHWKENRYNAPYLRQSLWEHGYLVDTFETAANWDRIETLQQQMELSLKAVAGDTPLLCYTHLSHVYKQGCSLYTTYVFPAKEDFDASLAQWRKFKDAASRAVVEGGGTISHQHGVGEDHSPYLHVEKDELTRSGIQALFDHYDPQGQMNPGKLLESP